jgi:hypothetical protein
VSVGWDGYFIAAPDSPGDHHEDELWGRDHLVRFHDIDPLRDSEIDLVHDEAHERGAVEVPHVHGTFVEEAIQRSTYSREVKDALLGLIAALDERERHAPEARR